MPEGTPQEILLAAVHSLRARLAMDSLPEEVRGALASSLDYLLRGGATTAAAEEPAPAEKPFLHNVAKGEILFNEGDEGDEAYLISEGMVDIYRVRDGREEVIASLGRGEIFGEMSLIDSLPRSASARTRQGASVIKISQGDLQKRMIALEKTDPLLKLLVTTLIRRLRGQVKGLV